MKVIEKIDTRKLSRETREHMRYQCIKLRSKGISRNEVAEILGVNLATISIWWSIYKREGAKVFKLGVPGKKEGTGRLLNKEQEKEIQRLLVDKTPEQLKFPFALWNRKAVKLLIKIADLAYKHDEISEMDLNPIFIYKDGLKAVDARIILKF